MATNIKPATELDFDNIKKDIIDHFKLNTTFSDYNFEGSALNTLIDVLAYNTHTNAYYANMIHNESFLDTAQKRSSVVSIAKELGYTPASVVCSTAYVDVILNGIDTNQYLTKGDSFGTYNENGPFTFLVANTVESAKIDDKITFSNVKIVNGIIATNTFTVDNISNVRSIFTIPNKNVDISTLSVYVKDSVNSISKTYYTQSTNTFESISTSKVYFIQESYEGYYQIYFGNNILGMQPINGNVITIEYIVSSNNNEADGCRTFSPNFSFGSGVNVITKQNSFGGKQQEQIESIRINAVKNNTTKLRAVTEDDYNVILRNKFPFVKNCIVWGGEKNIPPVYGKVFISLQPVSGYTIDENTKTEVVIPELRKNAMLTIVPVIVDPEYLSVEFITRVKFNRYKTTRTNTDVSILVKNKIKSFMDDLSTFGLDYYQSNLVYQLIDLDPGIISINIKKLVGFNISPLVNVVTLYERTLANEIEESSINSDSFDCYINNKIYTNVVIKEVPNTKTIDSIKTIGIYSLSSGVLISNIGVVNLSTGYMKFSINLVKYNNSKNYLSIRCNLINDDVNTNKNQILIIDSTMNTSLSKNDNMVLIENYAV